MTKCKICRGEFVKRSMTHKCCSPECAAEYAKLERVKSAARIERKARQETRAKLNNLKTLSDHARETQVAFNKWVRYRDKGQPCISCQKPFKGQIHAGHFRSVGAAKQLRFEPDNCHAQCAQCNTKLSGNLIEYRKGLVKRVGEARVIELEHDNTVKRWTRDELQNLKAYYTKLAKGVSTAQSKSTG